MRIAGAVAFVTGANRGLGREFVRQLAERGAATIYAAARDPGTIDRPGVVPVALDITDPAAVTAAAARAGDVTLLVNNAGISTGQNIVAGDPRRVRAEMETNYFGTLGMVRAFAPRLAANGGGAILNVLSVASWIGAPGHTGYAASKAAEWGLTNAIRAELAGQGTQVTGLHLGLADTDMTRDFDLPKIDPADVIRAAIDGIEAGASEVLADDVSRRVKAALAGDPAALLGELLGGTGF